MRAVSERGDQMDDPGLLSAQYWVDVLEILKRVGGIMVVVGVAFELGGDWIGAPFHKRLDGARELQIATLATEAETARGDIARATAETAKAKKATEEIRRKNIELERTLSPLSL
jgi:hypothetical protein